jgi:hypothetical protein
VAWRLPPPAATAPTDPDQAHSKLELAETASEQNGDGGGDPDRTRTFIPLAVDARARDAVISRLREAAAIDTLALAGD